MTATATLLTECGNMLLAIAPELRRVYAIDRPADWPLPSCDGDAFALTQRDHQIEQHLRDTNRWRGPGAIAVFDLCRIRERYGGDFELAVTALAIHEGAHLVLLPARQHDELLPSTMAEVEHDVQLNRKLAALPPAQGLPPWSGDHGARFIRAVIHLATRAWALGYKFPGEHLAAGSQYGLSPLAYYASRLGDEPERLRSESFAAIESSPPPTAFSKLWADDVAAWQAENNFQKLEQVA